MLDLQVRDFNLSTCLRMIGCRHFMFDIVFSQKLGQHFVAKMCTFITDENPLNSIPEKKKFLKRQKRHCRANPLNYLLLSFKMSILYWYVYDTRLNYFIVVIVILTQLRKKMHNICKVRAANPSHQKKIILLLNALLLYCFSFY